jgi:hypothetical protein
MTYYLHQGTTKTGKPKYHFSTKRDGMLADTIPEGFEIYEAPDSRVFLRRIPPKIIWDEEKQVVEDGMRKYSGVQDYKIDVRDNTIEVYTCAPQIFYLHMMQGVPRFLPHDDLAYTTLDIRPQSRHNRTEKSGRLRGIHHDAQRLKALLPRPPIGRNAALAYC